MFVDASAIVAVITRESGYVALASVLKNADSPITSGIAIVEAVMAVRRIGGGSVVATERIVRQFLEAARIAEISMTAAETTLAISAYARFGKGQAHPAQLNMGDCFAYACARTHDVPLLYVCEDFSQTDIRAALA